jgi:hypothetical protein
MFLIVSKYLIPKGYRGLTLFPFVIVRTVSDGKEPVVMNHEKIHIRQQLELLVLPFFIWYGLDYLYKLMRYRNTDKAYRNIIFEREAYANEKDLHYLKSRPLWNFLKWVNR